MRLEEITKDRFKKKLKYPMELVDGITQEIQRVNDDFDKPWITAESEPEFGDDYVAWNIEVQYEPTNGDVSGVFGDTIEHVYEAVVRNYQTWDIPLSFHRINREEGYILMGIQLGV